jgi:hypothetical protein
MWELQQRSKSPNSLENNNRSYCLYHMLEGLQLLHEDGTEDQNPGPVQYKQAIKSKQLTLFAFFVLQFQSVQMVENPYSSPYLSTTTHEASYRNNMNVPN